MFDQTTLKYKVKDMVDFCTFNRIDKKTITTALNKIGYTIERLKNESNDQLMVRILSSNTELDKIINGLYKAISNAAENPSYYPSDTIDDMAYGDDIGSNGETEVI